MKATCAQPPSKILWITDSRQHLVQKFFRLRAAKNGVFSVYGESLFQQPSPGISPIPSFAPYTEDAACDLNFYQLLGSSVRHTRCGRHIAESHKRVQ